MISGSGNNIYIKNHSGRTIYFDRELLQEAIRKAAEASGSRQVALAEDISYAIEKYLESMRDSKEPMPELREVNSFVVNLLSDAGHEEIAHTYASLHTADWDRQTARELKEWSSTLVYELISKNPLFQNYDAVVLGEAVNSRLDKLGFAQVSDSLVVELAAHLIANDAYREAEPETEEQEQEPANSKHLLYATEIVKFSKGDSQFWFAGDVLQARDISRLFPKLHIDLNFLLYVQKLQQNDEMALMELMFLPTLSEFVRGLAGSFVNVINFIEATFPDVTVPCFLTIDAFDSALSSCFKLVGRRKAALKKEIAGLIEREFTAVCDKAVKIVYIKEE